MTWKYFLYHAMVGFKVPSPLLNGSCKLPALPMSLRFGLRQEDGEEGADERNKNSRSQEPICFGNLLHHISSIPAEMKPMILDLGSLGESVA